MDGPRFDALTRTLTVPRSRRSTLGGLAGGILVALGLVLDEMGALAKKKKRKKAKKKKQCSAGKPIRCGRDCCRPDETCKNGTCLDHCDDGVLNFGETDVDCGGSCRAVRKCRLGKACAEATDCFNNVCNGSVCTECLIDSDCDGLGNPLRFRCFDEFCFECAFDFDCPRPGQGAKQTVCINKRCVECASGADCPAARPFCMTDLNEECVDNAVRPCACRQCRDDVDCASGQVCNDENGSCVECVSDPDCAGRPGTPVCIDGSCKQCRSRTDCESDFCHPTDHVCSESCDPDAPSPCPEGFSCLDCCEDCSDGTHCFAGSVCP
jgi:hypothetical protein